MPASVGICAKPKWTRTKTLHRFSNNGNEKKFIAPLRSLCSSNIVSTNENLYISARRSFISRSSLSSPIRWLDAANACAGVCVYFVFNFTQWIHIKFNRKLLRHHCTFAFKPKRSKPKMKWATFWRTVRLGSAIFFLHLSHLLVSSSFASYSHFEFAMVLVFAIMAWGAKLNEIYDTIIKMSEPAFARILTKYHGETNERARVIEWKSECEWRKIWALTAIISLDVLISFLRHYGFRLERLKLISDFKVALNATRISHRRHSLSSSLTKSTVFCAIFVVHFFWCDKKNALKMASNFIYEYPLKLQLFTEMCKWADNGDSSGIE